MLNQENAGTHRRAKPASDPTKAYDRSVPAPHRQIVQLLHREIDAVLKNKAEARMYHAMPVWFVDGNAVVGYKSRAQHVTLLFWNGQAFGEPELEAAGKFEAAQIHYTRVDEIDVTTLRRWLMKSGREIWDFKARRAACN